MNVRKKIAKEIKIHCSAASKQQQQRKIHSLSSSIGLRKKDAWKQQQQQKNAKRVTYHRFGVVLSVRLLSLFLMNVLQHKIIKYQQRNNKKKHQKQEENQTTGTHTRSEYFIGTN